MSDLVGNPKDRFSHDAAHMSNIKFVNISRRMPFQPNDHVFRQAGMGKLRSSLIRVFTGKF